MNYELIGVDMASGPDVSVTSVTLPLRIESVANKREHWAVRSQRTAMHRLAAIAVPVHPVPCTVRLIRIAPRALDDDNNVSGFKALRDGIAKRMGVDDRDPRVQWRYGQERGRRKEYAVRVEITAGGCYGATDASGEPAGA